MHITIHGFKVYPSGFKLKFLYCSEKENVFQNAYFHGSWLIKVPSSLSRIVSCKLLMHSILPFNKNAHLSDWENDNERDILQGTQFCIIFSCIVHPPLEVKKI